MEFGFDPLQAVVAFRDRPHTFLKDDLLGGRRADHVREPAQMGGAPIRPPRIANILPQQEGFKAQLGGFQIFEDIFSRSGQVADGFILDRRDIHRGEIARPHQASQLHGIPPIGLYPVACFFRNQRWSNHPTLELLLHQIPIQPVAAGARFIDEDQLLGFGLELTDQLVNVALAGADIPSETTSACRALLTYATAIVSLWTSKPM